MSRSLILATVLCGSIAFAQGPKPDPAKPNNPPLQASFGLIDPSILVRQGQKKPEIGKNGPAPRLADGKPDLTGPWAPNAIAENVNLVGIGVQVPFKPEAKAMYKSRIARLGKDDPEARCLPRECRA